MLESYIVSFMRHLLSIMAAIIYVIVASI